MSTEYPYCIADPGYSGRGLAFTDQAWVNSDTGYLLSNNFGEYFGTTDGLTGTAGGTTELGNGSLNGQTPDTDGIEYTTDGGTDWTTVTYANTTESDVLNDIASEGMKHPQRPK